MRAWLRETTGFGPLTLPPAALLALLALWLGRDAYALALEGRPLPAFLAMGAAFVLLLIVRWIQGRVPHEGDRA